MYNKIKREDVEYYGPGVAAFATAGALLYFVWMPMHILFFLIMAVRGHYVSKNRTIS